MQLKSILCPIDFSDFSAAAYQYALSLAEYYKSRLVALHVVELWKYPFADYAAHEADYAKFSKALSEGGEVQLQRFVKEYSTDGLQLELVIHQGNASNSILSCAQNENIEVIVMGTHGRRGFDRLVLGSTTGNQLTGAYSTSTEATISSTVADTELDQTQTDISTTTASDASTTTATGNQILGSYSTSVQDTNSATVYETDTNQTRTGVSTTSESAHATTRPPAAATWRRPSSRSVSRAHPQAATRATEPSSPCR